MSKLAGKKCLVTGGGRGIGRAIAVAFAKEGAAVAVIDRDASTLAATIDALVAMNVTAAWVVGEVQDEASISTAVRECEAALGGIDVLVNNAGIVNFAPVETMSVEMWDEMMAINLRSVFLCSKLVIPGMKSRGWGRIISLSSQLAHKGAKELAHYAAAKAGIIGFTRALAREVIDFGITVNTICPGPIETELTQMNPPALRADLTAQIPTHRYGNVQEIVPTAVLLASNDGSFYVGATLNPNGGDVMV
jgi:3-oxoacyl-[acyl-carrier protein] reductase